MTWQPAIGDRVRVVASDRTGTIVHITLTEWGFLYDVEQGDPTRRTYAAGELTPAEPSGPATKE